jgi:cation diffusion facilitator family transporter
MTESGQDKAPTVISVKQRQRSIQHVLMVVLMLDLLLAFAKGGYGYLTGSVAMISDGLHSTIHAAGNVVGLVGVHLAARPADASHPYGYERYEPLAAMGIAVLMIAAVWEIIKEAWIRFHSHGVSSVTALSFAIIIASILLTIGLSLWERRRAQVLASAVLQADAARVRSDTLVSGAVLVGLLSARFGYPFVDPAVSVVVAAVIARTSWGLVRGASYILADGTAGNIEDIARAACSVAGVRGCHEVRARGSGGMVRIDLHITVDPQMTVANSHELAEEVERQIRAQVGGVTEVLVHVGVAKDHAGAPQRSV